MSYATEGIIRTLKQAREAKGLTQRDLGARTGVPQSHISKIESGGTDIRLSSLIELARALDLELTLVPRKSVPAVETVIRSTAPASAARQTRETARTIRDFERTMETVKSLQAAYPDLTALTQLQDSLQSIRNLQSAGRDFGAFLTSIRKSYEPLQRQLEQVRKASESLKAPSQETLRSLTQAAENIRRLRNQIVHGAPPPALPRPAYHLDEDDRGDDNG
jgi:transcriptional regulator with XRE-family HTH domain